MPRYALRDFELRGRAIRKGAARFREDLVQWSEQGIFRRPLTLPIELDPPPAG